MYQEFLNDARGGRDPDATMAGDASYTSPGDTSELPPTGEQLAETEPEESKAAAFRRELYKPETIDGIHGTIEHDANDIQTLLERPPTGSHADVPTSPAHTARQAPEHATASDLTMAALTLGMMVFEAGRWIQHKLEDLKGR